MDLSEISSTDFSEFMEPIELGEALCAGLRADDEQAVNCLYDFIRRLVFAYISRQDISRGFHEDVAQDAFVTIFNAVRGQVIRHPQALVGYIRTVVRRKCGDMVGAMVAARLGGSDGFSTLEDFRLPIEKQILEAQQLSQTQRAMAQLPDRFRLILEDFYLRDLPREKIMERYKLSENQFRLLKSRGLQKVRKAVSSQSIRLRANVA